MVNAESIFSFNMHLIEENKKKGEKKMNVVI